MTPTDELCGRCGQLFQVKVFRNADVLVCQGCQTVTLQKADFKRLLTGTAPDLADASLPIAPPPPPPARPAPPAPSSALGKRSPPPADGAPEATPLKRRFADEPSLGPLTTDDTDEFPHGPELGTFAPTEVDAPDPSFDLGLPGTPPRAARTTRSAPEVDVAADDGFDAALEAYQAKRSQSTWIAGVAILAVLGLVGLGLAGIAALAWWSGPSTPSEPVIAAAPVPAPVAPTPVAPVPSTPDVIAPAPVVPAPSAPAAAPEPSASPSAPPAGVAAIVKQGWTAFDRSPAEAEPIFLRALQQRPDHADANYGYGYALLKQGRAAEATPHLCKAQSGGDAEISRDIRSLLTHNGLSCEPR